MKRIPLIAILLLTACSSQPEEPRGVSFGSPRSNDIASPDAPSKLLDFHATLLGGGQVVGSELVGKDVAIWSWAPW